jgi:four helix bundle protein
MAGVTSYRELIAWQKAVDLVVTVYKVTDQLPSDEKFGLTHQVRRAAVSVPSNIAEGQGRSSVNEFLRFLSISRGSLCELETQILIAQRLGFISDLERDHVLRDADEVGRLLRGLSRSIGPR